VGARSSLVGEKKVNLQIIVGAIVVSLCSQGSSYAQIEKPRKAPPTRIAVVNIRVVFQKYWRAQGLKQEFLQGEGKEALR
jgi:Skp family chaperone for outer membrane proteins